MSWILTPPLLSLSTNRYTCLFTQRERRGALCSVCSQCECRERESRFNHSLLMPVKTSSTCRSPTSQTTPAG